MTIETAVRRVATYERVSSEDQRERETIKTQTDELARRLDREPDVELVERYADDGVSGTIPLAERPAGRQLMAGASAGRFGELWVYKLDRLGRDAVDLLVVRRRLIELGIRVISVVEAEPDLLSYDVQAVVADHYRREFLRRSADGMNRAAREGRYPGGIVAFGFVVAGTKESARLVPDTALLWADLSATDVVRRIYGRIGIDGWTCPRVAAELNDLGVPTHYGRDGRGVRGKRTQGVWRCGRIRNLVLNPVYKGVLQYGRRANRQREVIAASVEPLVSPELWQAAQETLARNRTVARNTVRRYLLKGVMHCAIDGLTYVGSRGRDGVAWYRCGGQLVERGPLPGRCPGQSIRTDAIEPIIWADVDRWLRDPGDVLADLECARAAESQSAIAEAESITIGRALEALEAQRKQVLALNIRGRLPDVELDGELDRIAAERIALEARVAALESRRGEEVPEMAIDSLAKIRTSLDAGLTDEQRQEVIGLLVRVTIQTELALEGRKKSAKAVVEYRFPAPAGVVETRTGTDSSRPRAGSGPASPPRRPRVRSQSGLPRVAGEVPRVRRGRIPAARRGTGHRDDTACVNVTLRHRPIVAKVRRSPCRPEATTRRDSSACRAVEMTNQVGLGAATK
jgi:site-specific DNA recombinase